MAILVVLETVALGLLAVLVAGLLRSHAEILRRLHELGSGYGDELGPRPRPDRRDRRRAGTVPKAEARAAPTIAGSSPSGDALVVGMGRPGERTLLLFVSSGCHRCQRWWDALRAGAHHQLDARVVVVGRDADEESPTTLASLAPPDLTVVLSSAAWELYGVPGSPYAVHVGETGSVTGEGTAATWEQLLSLVTQSTDDRAVQPGDRAGEPGGRQKSWEQAHDARVDRELAAAGILPGDPSLHRPAGR
jgi:hypothetical protein